MGKISAVLAIAILVGVVLLGGMSTMTSSPVSYGDLVSGHVVKVVKAQSGDPDCPPPEGPGDPDPCK